MTSNISEKSFKELNTLMSEVNVQMEELNKKKEEISAAIQKRKEQVKANFVLHSNQYMEAYRQMMEDTRLMIEMGIDPTSISADPVIDDNVEVETVEGGHVSSKLDVPEEINEEGPASVYTIEDIDTSDDTKTAEEMEVVDVDCSDPTTLKNGRYTPFFYLLNNRKGAFPKNGTTNKIRKSTRLLTPYYKLTGSELINRSLPMGNLKYRDSYPNPDESRIYSADGIAPTITAMHSDLHVWIGPRQRTHIEPITLTDAA